jgi:hypothetical protein
MYSVHIHWHTHTYIKPTHKEKLCCPICYSVIFLKKKAGVSFVMCFLPDVYVYFVLLLFIVAIVQGRGFANSIDIKPELFSISTNAQKTIKIDAAFRVGNDLPFIVEIGSGAFDLSYALVSEGKIPEYSHIGHSHVHSISSVTRNTNRLAHMTTEISESISSEQISEIEQSLWGRQLRFRIKGTIPVFAKILFVKIPYIKHIDCSYAYAHHPPVPTDIQCLNH